MTVDSGYLWAERQGAERRGVQRASSCRLCLCSERRWIQARCFFQRVVCALQVFFDTYQILHSKFKMNWNTIISSNTNKALLVIRMWQGTDTSLEKVNGNWCSSCSESDPLWGWVHLRSHMLLALWSGQRSAPCPGQNPFWFSCVDHSHHHTLSVSRRLMCIVAIIPCRETLQKAEACDPLPWKASFVYLNFLKLSLKVSPAYKDATESHISANKSWGL